MITALLMAAVVAASPYPGPRRHPARAGAPVAAVDQTLSDAEVRARVENDLSSIDVPITDRQWQALGPRAVPALQATLQDSSALPSRRAAAVAGLAAIGGAQARRSVLEAAEDEGQPSAVRTRAVRSAARFLSAQELSGRLTPLLRDPVHPAVRAAAAEVLARSAPRSACGAIRAQAEREGPARGTFARALERCGAAP
jgi:hypothetical protein